MKFCAGESFIYSFIHLAHEFCLIKAFPTDKTSNKNVLSVSVLLPKQRFPTAN